MMRSTMMDGSSVPEPVTGPRGRGGLGRTVEERLADPAAAVRRDALRRGALSVTLMEGTLDRLVTEIGECSTNKEGEERIRDLVALIRNPRVTEVLLVRLLDSSLFSHRNLDAAAKLWNRLNVLLRAIVVHPCCPGDVLWWAVHDTASDELRILAVSNPSVTLDQVRAAVEFYPLVLSGSTNQQAAVMEELLLNVAVSREFLLGLLPRLEVSSMIVLGEYFGGPAQQECVNSVLELTVLPSERAWAARLIENDDYLQVLARDLNLLVRVAVAHNEFASAAVISMLCNDVEPDVRRIAALHRVASEGDRVMVALRRG